MKIYLEEIRVRASYVGGSTDESTFVLSTTKPSGETGLIEYSTEPVEYCPNTGTVRSGSGLERTVERYICSWHSSGCKAVKALSRRSRELSKVGNVRIA